MTSTPLRKRLRRLMDGGKRTYNCSKCKRPKKKSCICKTTSEFKERIADKPDEQSGRVRQDADAWLRV